MMNIKFMLGVEGEVAPSPRACPLHQVLVFVKPSKGLKMKHKCVLRAYQ